MWLIEKSGKCENCIEGVWGWLIEFLLCFLNDQTMEVGIQFSVSPHPDKNATNHTGP